MGSMHPRYFVGIALPNVLSEQIQTIQTAVLKNRPVMEPLVPHITLLHPNILMTLSPLYFIPIIKEASQALLPISVELTGIDMFDERVLYIAVKCPGLITLQEKLVGMLPDDIRARYEVGREYTPHVTIAQAKPLQTLSRDVAHHLRRDLNQLLPTKFTAKALTQFTWQADRRYSILTI